jgi:hypothetical protein
MSGERERPGGSIMGNLSKFIGSGLEYPCANAYQPLKPKYTTIPQHHFIRDHGIFRLCFKASNFASTIMSLRAIEKSAPFVSK